MTDPISEQTHPNANINDDSVYDLKSADGNKASNVLAVAGKKVQNYIWSCFDYAAPIPVTPGKPPGWTRPGQPIGVHPPSYYKKKEQEEKDARLDSASKV